MKFFDWDDEKSQELKAQRGVSFEDVLFYIEKSEIIDIVENPNQAKYPGQRYFIVEIDDYVYYVPFVEDEKRIFLKTIIPSRKYMKLYKGGN